MSKVVVYEVEVMFGDCDPAGIVFFPNFSKWMDASSLNFFVKCGVPPWRELVKTRGIVGTPLLMFGIRHIGFVHTAWVAAAVALAVIVPLAVFVLKRRPQDLGLYPDGLPPAAGAAAHVCICTFCV